MKSKNAEKLLLEIDQAIKDITSLSGISALEMAYLAKFLVVFTSGIFEEAIEIIINEWVAKVRSPQISNYIEKSIDQIFRNPKSERIKELLQKFDKSWLDIFNTIPGSSVTSLDSIVNSKNALAHGSTCTVTLNEVIQYYKDSKIIIEKLDNRIL